MRWIKIYDTLLTWRWAHKPEYMAFAVHCLLRANPTPWKWEKYDFPMGSFVTSMVNFSAEVGITPKQYRTILKNLQDCGFLVAKGANKFTLITICNYGSYQENKNQKGKQTANEGQPDGKRSANEGQPDGKQGATDIDIKNIDFKDKENKEFFLKGGKAEKKIFKNIEEIKKVLNDNGIFMKSRGYQVFMDLNQRPGGYWYRGGVVCAAQNFLKNEKNREFRENAPPAPPPPSDPKAVEVWERVKNRLNGTMYCVAFNKIFNPKTRALNFLNNGEILKIAVPTESVRNEIRAHAAEFYEALKHDNIRDLRFEIINS